MKIYLDDMRKAPEGFIHVSTPEICIAQIKSAWNKKIPIEILSLDHDLGLIDPITKAERTGYDVLLWLEENPQYMPNSILIHSANPVARRRMHLAIDAIERRIENALQLYQRENSMSV
jgi:hypothetical protein